MGECVCGKRLPIGGRGRIPTYCTRSCRAKAWRARQKATAEAIPVEIRELPQWTRRDGKRPVTTSGAPASSTDEATWTTHAEVSASTAGDGLGVMLGGGLACYDFDHCLQGGRVVSQRVAEVLARLDPIYAEVSMSGNGLHVFVRAEEGPGTRLPWMEFYSRARFIAVTGNRWEGPWG